MYKIVLVSLVTAISAVGCVVAPTDYERYPRSGGVYGYPDRYPDGRYDNRREYERQRQYEIDRARQRQIEYRERQERLERERDRKKHYEQQRQRAEWERKHREQQNRLVKNVQDKIKHV